MRRPPWTYGIGEKMNEEKIETNLYDEVEYHFDVAVQVLRNSVTGEQSIGWAPMGSDIVYEWLEDEYGGN